MKILLKCYFLVLSLLFYQQVFSSDNLGYYDEDNRKIKTVTSSDWGGLWWAKRNYIDHAYHYASLGTNIIKKVKSYQDLRDDDIVKAETHLKWSRTCAIQASRSPHLQKFVTEKFVTDVNSIKSLINNLDEEKKRRKLNSEGSKYFGLYPKTILTPADTPSKQYFRFICESSQLI